MHLTGSTTVYNFNFENEPISIPSAGNYTFRPAVGSNQFVWFADGVDYNAASLELAGVVDITGDTRTDQGDSYPGFLSIGVSTGSDCARAPVEGVIDPSNEICGVADGVLLNARVILDGAIDPSTGSMRAVLTDNIPITEPYGNIGFIHVNNTVVKR